MQKELSSNVEALKSSKQQLEATVEDLQRAKEQEQRLVELGYAVAEFGHDTVVGSGDPQILSDFRSQLYDSITQRGLPAILQPREDICIQLKLRVVVIVKRERGNKDTGDKNLTTHRSILLPSDESPAQHASSEK